MLNPSESSLDIFKERYLLSQALMNSIAGMTRSTKPETILSGICDALTDATEHIKLAWTRFGQLDLDEFYPSYIVGNVPICVDENNPVRRNHSLTCCPVYDAIDSWSTITCNIKTEGEKACVVGMASVATLPVGQKDSELAGIVTLYSDMPAYFEQVGTEFFDAFIHLANSSLDQCALLNDLTHLASHDLLTSLLNRRGIQEAMERELARSKRTGSPFSILLFDADRFKLINDRLGHKQGDLVLKSIALSAATGLRDEDYLARWGGEEFICLLPNTSRDEAIQIAERMRNDIKSTSVSVATVEINITASFGVASYPLDGTSIDKLIAAADAALYQAKRTGRDRSVSAHIVQEGVHSLCNTLDAALNEGRIVPAFQPIVDLQTGEVVAEETLARLVTNEGEIIPAENFIGAAHQLQMLHRIDESIIKQAFSHCVTGLETGTNRLNHFVNVSADLLRHRELVNELLAEALKSCCSCAGMIGPVKPMVIEITERELLDDIATAKELLMPFIDFGLRLALDDFGSGYSSYQYLADLPVSFLKIDGTLIKRIQEPKVRAIVQGIQDTADALDIITLAEFVEDKETESILKEIGINWAQGYLYGKPEIAQMQTNKKFKLPK